MWFCPSDKTRVPPYVGGHCRAKEIERVEREWKERFRENEKQPAGPQKTGTKELLPSSSLHLPPAPWTWLINHLRAINHLTSSAGLTDRFGCLYTQGNKGCQVRLCRVRAVRKKLPWGWNGVHRDSRQVGKCTAKASVLGPLLVSI